MQAAVAVKVSVEAKTASPGPMPHASAARWRPAVAQDFDCHGLNAVAHQGKQVAVQTRGTSGPVVSHPDLSTETAASTSRSPIDGRKKGMRILDLVPKLLPQRMT